MLNDKTMTQDVEEKLALEARRRPAWFYVVVIATTATVIAGAAWYAVTGIRDDSTTRFVTMAVEKGTLNVKVTATGTLQPLNEVEISSELSGIVRTVFVDYNDRVTKGQVLAELDTERLEAELAHAKASLQAARARVREQTATLAEAKRNFSRYEKLTEHNVTSEQKFDEAEAAFARAQASLESAEADVAVETANLRLQETLLRKACICAPTDGIVLDRQVEPGQTVASSLQAPILFRIAEDLSQIELLVDIDEADVSEVRAGQTAEFTVDAYPDRRFKAEITKVRYAPEASEGVVIYKAHLAVDNADLALRPGMTATADILVQTVEDALLVSNEALRFVPPTEEETSERSSFLKSLMFRPPGNRSAPKITETGRARHLWILRDGELEALPVTVGVSDGVRTEITSGNIEAGQQVVVDLAGASL